MSLEIRTMDLLDIDRVMAIQKLSYNEIVPEPHEPMTFKAMLQSPETVALVALLNGNLCGYLISYRTSDNHLSPLGELGDLADGGRAWYIHDLAVLPDFRNQKIASKLYRHAEKLVRNSQLRTALLVALESAVTFWQTLKFKQIDFHHPAMQHSTSNYCVMQKKLRRF